MSLSIWGNVVVHMFCIMVSDVIAPLNSHLYEMILLRIWPWLLVTIMVHNPCHAVVLTLNNVATVECTVFRLQNGVTCQSSEFSSGILSTLLHQAGCHCCLLPLLWFPVESLSMQNKLQYPILYDFFKSSFCMTIYEEILDGAKNATLPIPSCLKGNWAPSAYIFQLIQRMTAIWKIYMQCMRNPSAQVQGHDLEDEGQGHR